MCVRRSNGVRPGTLSRLALGVAAAGLAVAGMPAKGQVTPAVGVVCTTGTSFTLTAMTGYIQLPDGNTAFMHGYAPGGAAFQHPGPVLCVNEGDAVTVTLQNALAEPVSIVFPGQEGVLANGVPSQPQLDPSGRATSLAQAAPPGGSITYTFTATRPGSFIYQSGTNPEKQVRMGLFGGLIVRPTLGPAFAYDRPDSQFTPSEEFMVLLSEIDPIQHQRVEQGRSFNLNNYKPRYWLINGRGFPDTVADNGAPWLPAQPYGALAKIHEFNDTLPPGDPNYHPHPGRIHYLNVASQSFPFHPHGNNGEVIGRDGSPLEAGPGGADVSFEKFAIHIGPGQTWDVIFKWYDAERYSLANPVNVTIPDPANMQFGMYWSGSPYLGQSGPLPPGANSLNVCGEHYIISHNHALFQINSWGMTMSGPITYVRIDPPYPNDCP